MGEWPVGGEGGFVITIWRPRTGETHVCVCVRNITSVRACGQRKWGKIKKIFSPVRETSSEREKTDVHKTRWIARAGPATGTSISRAKRSPKHVSATINDFPPDDNKNSARTTSGTFVYGATRPGDARKRLCRSVEFRISERDYPTRTGPLRANMLLLLLLSSLYVPFRRGISPVAACQPRRRLIIADHRSISVFKVDARAAGFHGCDVRNIPGFFFRSARPATYLEQYFPVEIHETPTFGRYQQPDDFVRNLRVDLKRKERKSIEADARRARR